MLLTEAFCLSCRILSARIADADGVSSFCQKDADRATDAAASARHQGGVGKCPFFHLMPPFR